jgi:hypothetical protein
MRSITWRGLWVVAALSSQTSGLPLMRSARMGKSRRTACTSKPGWRSACASGVLAACPWGWGLAGVTKPLGRATASTK